MKKILIILGIVVGLGLVGGLGYYLHQPAQKLGNSLYTTSYLNAQFALTNSSTTFGSVIASYPGVLHSVTVDTPVSSSIISLYDSTSTTIIVPTFATGSFTIATTTTATSTASGTISVVINGTTITSGVLGLASTSNQAAPLITAAINASSTSLNGITAVTASNVVNLTAFYPGTAGNFSATITSPQLGFTTSASTISATQGTTQLAKITIPYSLAVAPFTLTFDANFFSGLVINQTTGTSTITLNYQGQ